MKVPENSFTFITKRSCRLVSNYTIIHNDQ
jgi:hypothetical protein